jgi:hypothetical protein
MDILKQLEEQSITDAAFVATADTQYAQACSEWAGVRRELVGLSIALRQSPVPVAEAVVKSLMARCMEIDAAIFDARYLSEDVTQASRVESYRDIVQRVASVKSMVSTASTAFKGVVSPTVDLKVPVFYTEPQFKSNEECGEALRKIA